MENFSMKTMMTMISATMLALSSPTLLAWGWGPYGQGYNGYYAPYGYGFPAAPANNLSEEQREAIAAQQKLIAEQQARLIENMQKAQQQAAEFYASQPAPASAAAPAFGEDPYLRQMDAMQEQMDAMHEARLQEMDTRMEAARKAADFYRPPFPAFAGEPAFEDSFDNQAYLRELEERRAARLKAYEARRDQARQAAAARRQAAEERFKARHQERPAPADAAPGV
jgi:hypothetical protein